MLYVPQDIRAEKIAGQSALLNVEKPQGETDDVHTKRMIQRSVIREILTRNNSPLVTEVDAFMDACIKHDIDCYLLPSISGLESSYGKHLLPGSHNPFGWGGGYLLFDSWSESFHAVAGGLKKNYIGRGADTIEEIGPIYAASPTWAERVRLIHNKFVALESEKKTDQTKIALGN